MLTHGKLGTLVGRLGEALERRGLDDRLTKSNDRIGDLDLNLRIDVPQIVHDAIDVELTGANDYMLARLLHLGAQQWVGLVKLAQTFQHFWKLRRVERLGGDLGKVGEGV